MLFLGACPSSSSANISMNDNESRLREEVAGLKSELERLKTEREKDVENLLQVAHAAKAAKNGFLTNMSHELRTPLTAIIGFAELLSDQHFGKLNERQYTYVREIYNAGSHLLALIKDILDLAKTESGSQTLKLSDVNISDLLRNSMSMVKERSIKHSQTLDLELEESLMGVVIKADEIKLKQILFNLLTNAVKFTPDGGHVRIVARNLDDRMSVSVIDSGIGIKVQDLDRIFDVFEQVDVSYSKQIAGTGLGLALTKRLVELHGGEIFAASDGVGCGATLTFTIPMVKTSPLPATGCFSDPQEQIDAVQEMPAWSVKGAGRPMVALVIEDNSSNLKLMVDLLEREGYRSLIAATAEDAMDTAIHALPDVILMDISLPGMDGLEATRLLKTNPDTRSIPVIAVTANAMRIDEKKAIDAGCDAYLPKPINPNEFVAVLKKVRKP